MQSGTGRTGKWWAIEHSGVHPDIVCIAKGIASGMPLGITMTRADIMDWTTGSHGSTFGGNPVCIAAALATIETIESEGLVARAAEIETFMKERLGRMQADDDRIGDVRGRGAMIAVELVKAGTTEPDPDLTKALCAGAHAAGVIVLSCGTYGNVLRFLPPLSISDELLDEGLDVLALVLKDL